MTAAWRFKASISLTTACARPDVEMGVAISAMIFRPHQSGKSGFSLERCGSTPRRGLQPRLGRGSSKEQTSADVPDHRIQPPAGGSDHLRHVGHEHGFRRCGCAQPGTGFLERDPCIVQLEHIARVHASPRDLSSLSLEGVDPPDDRVRRS